jgi:hypothetical protein
MWPYHSSAAGFSSRRVWFRSKVADLGFVVDTTVPRQDFQRLGFRLLIINSQKLTNYLSLGADTIGSSEATLLPHSYDLKNQSDQFFFLIQSPYVKSMNLSIAADCGQDEHVACHVMFPLFPRQFSSVKSKYFPSTWHIFEYLVSYFSQNEEPGFAPTNDNQINFYFPEINTTNA